MRGARDGIDPSAVRNLDQIQEDESGTHPSRAGALVLASLGGACIVFAAVLLLRSPPRAKVVSADPLGELVAHARPASSADAPSDGVGHDVTFPALLSDAKQPTTALEATRDVKADPRAASTTIPAALPMPPGTPGFPGPSGLPGTPGASIPGFDLPAGAPTTPPPAADRLPVVPLPAQNVLQGPQADPPPGDTLATMAKHVARETGGESAPAGGPGGYQLQVSSFKTQAEADAFASALRRRSHKAYVEPAQVKGRGLWYRVRVGPFKYRHAAVVYRQEFEAKERMVTFIVDPPKDKDLVKVRPTDDDDG